MGMSDSEKRSIFRGRGNERFALFAVVVMGLVAAGLFLRGCNRGEVFVNDAGEDVAVVDTSNMTIPVVDMPDIGADYAGGELDITGLAAPESNVDIFVNGTKVHTAPSDENGKWLHTVIFKQSGDYDLQAGIAEQPDLLSQPLRINVPQFGDPIAAAPAEDSSAADAGATAVAETSASEDGTLPTPMVTGVDNTTVGQVTISGTGQPAYPVSVRANGFDLGQVTADASGIWTYTDEFTAPGDYTIEAVSQLADGSQVASEPFVFTLTEGGADAAPAEEAPAEAGTLTDAAPAAGSPPTFSDSAPVISEPGTVTFQGMAAPDSRLQVLLNDNPYAMVNVGADGNWVYYSTFESAGDYSFSVRALDETGNPISETVTKSVQIMGVTFVPAITDVMIDPAQVGSVTLSGSAAPNATVQVVVDDVVTDTMMTDANGRWTHTASFADAGSYVLRLRHVDGSGNILAESNAAPIEVAAGAASTNAGEATTVVDSSIANGNIVDVLRANGNFTTLLTAIEAAGLTDALRGAGPLTLFAPDDAAFASLPEGTVDQLLAAPGSLGQILSYHVVRGNLSGAAVGSSPSLTTLRGDNVAVRNEGVVLVGRGAVVQPDITASNGVIHKVNAMLVPPQPGVNSPAFDESGIPFFRGPALNIVGTANPAGSLVKVYLNDEFFAQGVVDSEGVWRVSGNIEDGSYILVSYLYDPSGVLLGISNATYLANPGPQAP